MGTLRGKLVKVLALAAVGLQFVPVDRTNPPVTAGLELPEGPVGAVLRSACFDCHSNETHWPWYAHLAPVSFIVAHDVNEGRERLNFSTWSDLEVRTRAHDLAQLAERVEHGEMPPKGYAIGHADARLTEEDRVLVAEWARNERSQLADELVQSR